MLLLGGHVLCMMNALGLFLKGVMKRQKNYSALICFSSLCPKYIFLLLNCWWWALINQFHGGTTLARGCRLMYGNECTSCALESCGWEEVQKWNQVTQFPVNVKNISVNQESHLTQSFELNDFILIGNTCKAAEGRANSEPGKFLIGIFLSGRHSGQLCQDSFVSSLWGSKSSRWWILTEISCGGEKWKQECTVGRRLLAGNQ